jgi:glycosyltransferase involved in cell wall biosynthesis/polysaccharide pyruvyl transferase WcaK-like protein
MQKLCIFNVKYSENLGDGLLSECLEAALARELPNVKVVTLDLSGRRSYGSRSLPARSTILGLLQSLPPPIRRALVKLHLGPKLHRLSERWLPAVRGSDAVVIGGGQLFQDTDLNFPLKLAALANVCCSTDTPIFIYSVGVGTPWSSQAASLFHHLAAARVEFIGVRDHDSKQAWRSNFVPSMAPPIQICRDPALLAAAVFGNPPPPARSPALIGVGVTHPLLLRHHANSPITGLNGDLGIFIIELAKALTALGFRVGFFTNGAMEDENFLDRITNTLMRDDPSVRIDYRRFPRPRTPRDLFDIMCQVDGVVAHRLHANILAFALKRPHVGLSWDKKVDAFYKSIARGQYMVNDANAQPAQVAALAAKAVAEGIDTAIHNSVINEASAGIACLARSIEMPLADKNSAQTNPRLGLPAVMRHEEDQKQKTICTINGRFLTQKITGVQRYAREITREIDALIGAGNAPKGVQFEILAPPLTEAFPDINCIRNRTTRFGSGHFWDQIILPAAAAGPILNFCNSGPLSANDNIVCIHDLNTFVVPESYNISYRTFYNLMTPILARRARQVITVSNYSAEMLVKFGLCAAENIIVIPNGHEHALRWDASKSRLKVAQHIHRPFVLLLGSRARHKNINIVLRNHSALNRHGIDIVVAGGSAKAFATDSTAALTAPNIHWLGYVDDNELAALFSSALCFAFPSTAEGFGLPMLEAMVHGCPTIASNAASLPEVGGSAVVYASPESVDAWLEQIVSLAHAPDQRYNLSMAGRKRAKSFSWKASAKQYLQIILSYDVAT